MNIVNLPLVSVIMPVYNAEKYIAQALESILKQTYSNLEILIADDASNDNSKAIIELYNDSRIKKYHNETNLGYLQTCNKLFEIATGDFIAFQDADDWSELNRIEKTLSPLLNDGTLGMCGCNFKRINDKTNKIITQSTFPTTDHEIKEFIRKNKTLPFCGASVIFRKEVYKNIGGFRVFFDRIRYEHFDWFMLVSEKYKVANITDQLYSYRFVVNSFSRENRLFDYKKFYASKIAWFLHEQRIKYGFDALQNREVYPEFVAFLDSLEKYFWKDRYKVYRSVVLQMADNGKFNTALTTSLAGYKSKEIGFQSFLYLNFRILRSFIANAFNVR